MKIKEIKIRLLFIFLFGILSFFPTNAQNNNKNYLYQLNGVTAEGKLASIQETLLEEEWDIITMQQVSQLSGVLDSYFPYISIVNDFVKENCISAKRMLHETWSYEVDSDHPGFVNYNNDQKEMLCAIVSANKAVAKELDLPIIPTGHLLQELREKSKYFDYKNGGLSLCRDGFHLSLLYGRYAAAALWFELLFNENILNNSFVPEVDGVKADVEIITEMKIFVSEVADKSKENTLF